VRGAAAGGAQTSVQVREATEDMAVCDFVTVVSGVPRSGTSLVMQMLRAGGHPILTDGARAADAHNPRGYLELEAVKATRRDTSWVPDAVGRAVKVIHALVPALPEGFDYRIVLVTRPLVEVVASQRAMLARPSEAEAGLSEQRLVEIFAAQLRELERWAEREGARLLRLDYPGLVAAPQAGATALSRFLGGGLDEGAMAAAIEPALHRQGLGPGATGAGPAW